VDNNYLDLGMIKSGFIHTLPSGRLTSRSPLHPHHRRSWARDGQTPFSFAEFLSKLQSKSNFNTSIRLYSSPPLEHKKTT
jgi:hypothetical protein